MPPGPYSALSSQLSGGAQFLFGDVRFISEIIATGPANVCGSMYQNLAAINDGQPVSDF